MTMIIGPAAPKVFDDKARLEEMIANKTVRDLVSVDFDILPQQEQDRHRPYTLLLMNLVRNFWNGNRKGAIGTYPYRENQKTGDLYGRSGEFLGHVYGNGKEYFGHNIAAIAVDGNGQVIDFDFNHNDLFQSSLEHAEARLIRRLFSLTGLRSVWSLGDESAVAEKRSATTLAEVTVYSTLEPCAQCAGIMALARVKELVYLQKDDGAMRVANVLYNLRPYGSALRPIQAKHCGVGYGEALNQAYEEYKRQVTGGEPFYISVDPSEPPDRSQSLASFLCTDAAMDLYELGSKDFSSLMDRIEGDRSARPSGGPRTPQADLHEVKTFLDYVTRGGHRGTPH